MREDHQNPEIEETKETTTLKIAKLNNQLRENYTDGGMVYVHNTVRELEAAKQQLIHFHIQHYPLFYPNGYDNPEQSSGHLSMDGKRYHWSIRYIDLACWMAGSEKPATNPECPFSTYRILDIDAT